MADFLESAKSMVNAAVSRTSWEAQKQMRVRSKQTEIDKLLAQRQQLLDELGQIAMESLPARKVDRSTTFTLMCQHSRVGS